MLVTTSQGARFEVVLRPGPAGPSVPPPYTVEGFLATLLPAERRRLLVALASNPTMPLVDPSLLRTSATDVAVLRALVGLVQRKALGFQAPGAVAQRRSGGTGASGRSEASTPKEATQAAPPPAEVVCELLAAQATCSHKGRAANSRGVLEVVPGRDDDRLKLHADVRGGCGKHARWEIRGAGETEVKTGVDASFVAKSWGYKTLHIFEVLPRTYNVHVSCCTGMSRAFEVKAYPIDAWKVSLLADFKKPPTQWDFEVEIAPWEETTLVLKTELRKGLTDKKAQLEYVLDKVFAPLIGPTDKWEFFKTKLIFQGQWAEHTDHRAFYKYSGQLKLDPMVKGTFTIPFGPTAAIPPWIKRWVTDWVGDFYMYLKFEGELSLSGKWERSTPDTHDATVEGEGKVSVKVGANLFLMKKGALNVDANGGTSLTLAAKAPVAKKPAVEYDLTCGGLEVEVTIEAAWGMVEYKRKWKPIEGGSLFGKPKVWYPLGA